MSKVRLDPKRTATIIIDMQEGFADDGELPVKGSRALVAGINAFTEAGETADIGITIFTGDDHGPNHCSFKIFPPHCVRNTKSAQFMTGLRFPHGSVIHLKGHQDDVDSLSPFASNPLPDGRRIESELDGFLSAFSLRITVFAGVAGEYCDRAAVIDALERGHEVYLCRDLIAFVDESKREEVFAELERMGAHIIDSTDIEWVAA